MIRINTKSVAFGAALGLALALLLGAGASNTSKARIMPQRFLVLESSAPGDAANGWHSHLLKLCPHYGKIDRQSLKFRLNAETQEIKMLVRLNDLLLDQLEAC